MSESGTTVTVDNDCERSISSDNDMGDQNQSNEKYNSPIIVHRDFEAVNTGNILSVRSDDIMNREDENNREFHLQPPPPLIAMEEIPFYLEGSDFPAGHPSYLLETFNNYKIDELKCPIKGDYLALQTGISNEDRIEVINWISKIHYFNQCQQETLYAATYIFEKYLSVNRIQRDHLYLLGITCLRIAIKLDNCVAPKAISLSKILLYKFSPAQIVDMEKQIVDALNYDFIFPTRVKFIDIYIRLAAGDAIFYHITHYLIETSLLISSLMKELPSKIASATLYLAKKLVGHPVLWNEQLQKATGYEERDLIDISNTMGQFLCGVKPTNNYIWLKYSYDSRCRASTNVHNAIGNYNSFHDFLYRNNLMCLALFT